MTITVEEKNKRLTNRNINSYSPEDEAYRQVTVKGEVVKGGELLTSAEILQDVAVETKKCRLELKKIRMCLESISDLKFK